MLAGRVHHANPWLRLDLVGAMLRLGEMPTDPASRNRLRYPTGLAAYEVRLAAENGRQLCEVPLSVSGGGFAEVPRRRAQRRRKYDCLVTDAECARTQIPDAPLPRLRGGPA